MLRTELNRWGVIDLSISGVTQTLSMTPGAALQTGRPYRPPRSGRGDDGCRGPCSHNQRCDVTEFHWCVSIFLDFCGAVRAGALLGVSR
jgi:hypothetical protein